jgi:hypothetical protein
MASLPPADSSSQWTTHPIAADHPVFNPSRPVAVSRLITGWTIDVQAGFEFYN